MRTIVEDLEVRDIVVVAQQSGDLALQLRDRHVHSPVSGGAGIPNARQHICDGICQAHTYSFPLPAGLAHARDFPLQGELTETDTAEAELPQHSAGAAAPLAAAHRADLELRRAFGSFNPGSLCHSTLFVLLVGLLAIRYWSAQAEAR